MDELKNEEINNDEVKPTEEDVRPARKKPGPKPKVKVDEATNNAQDTKDTQDAEEVNNNKSLSSSEPEQRMLKPNEDEILNEVKGKVIQLKKPVRCYSRPYESAQNIIIKCTVRLTGYEFNGYVQVRRMKPGFGMVNGYIKKESIMRILTE